MTTIPTRKPLFKQGDRLERISRKPISNDHKEKGVYSVNNDQGSKIQRYWLKCWNCKKTCCHQAKDCQIQKLDNTGQSGSVSGAKIVQSDAKDDPL